MKTKTYSIGEVSQRLHLSIETIYYYDREGLLPKIARDTGGRRRFTADNIQVIQMILALRRADVPVKSIATFLSWRLSDANDLQKCYEFLDQHEATLIDQIQTLTTSLHYLQFKKWYYHTASQQGLAAANDLIHQQGITVENYRQFVEKSPHK